MEDIVGILVKTASTTCYAFLTWGRLFDGGDEELISIVEKNLDHFHLKGNILKIEICDNLGEVSSARYFYECFFAIGQEKIPFGSKYSAWRRKKQKEVSIGKGLFFLGSLASQPRQIQKKQ